MVDFSYYIHKKYTCTCSMMNWLRGMLYVARHMLPNASRKAIFNCHMPFFSTFMCRLSPRQRLCHRACGTCCRRCNCVPPGTAGNQEKCPCYTSQVLPVVANPSALKNKNYLNWNLIWTSTSIINIQTVTVHAWQ